MKFSDVMKIMLPPINGKEPRVISVYGRPVENNQRHGGIDFNYIGGQKSVNLEHPTIFSPINGAVVSVGGQYGTIGIIDVKDYVHEILHTYTQNVTERLQLAVGDPIGTMGGTGAYRGRHHVHYQIKDRNGKKLDPRKWWDDGEDNPPGPSRPKEYYQKLVMVFDPAVIDVPTNSPYLDADENDFAGRANLSGDSGAPSSPDIDDRAFFLLSDGNDMFEEDEP
jgi:murein DD-endopeptidase MepM/ murein hydrolase activator NlpD